MTEYRLCDLANIAFKNRDRKEGISNTLEQSVHFAIWLLLRLGNIKVKVYGEEKLLTTKDRGALVFVGNHPFALPEVLALGALVGQYRPDTKAIARPFAKKLPGVESRIITTTQNPDKKQEVRDQISRHLKEDKAIFIFPGGGKKDKNEPVETLTGPEVDWNSGVGHIVGGTYTDGKKLPYMPVFVGMENPEDEIILKNGGFGAIIARVWNTLVRGYPNTMTIHFGDVITPEEFGDAQTPREMTQEIKDSVYRLNPTP